MKRSRFSEARIAYILRQVEDGRGVRQVCRDEGITELTYLNWKKAYATLSPGEASQLQKLEDERTRLTSLVSVLRRAGEKPVS